MDQVVRSAIGVETGEPVRVTAVLEPRRRLADRLGERLVPAPTYVVCRVQAADPVSMERDVALIASIAMAVSGASAGDEVVLEGIPTDGQPPAPVRLRAFPVNEDFQGARKALTGGGVDSRYPSARDALGLWPDLPWVYLDLDARQRLGLGATRVAAVRLRASRKDQLLRETREILLVLAIALFGLVSLVTDGRVQAVLVAVVVLLAVGVVISRTRRRITRHSVRGRGRTPDR